MSALTFGKHRGEEICDVPLDYLQWLEEQPFIHNQIELHREIKHEINLRTGDRSSIGFERNKGKINLK